MTSASGDGRPLTPTMHAAVLVGPGALDVREVPTPVVGPDDVLVAVDLCGVCGTDLHLVLEGWARPGTWQGHEWVGTVAAVGADVTRWRPGDGVVGGPPPTCGECRGCRAGRPTLCEQQAAAGTGAAPGAFAGFKLAGQDELLALPDGLDPRAAALTEPLAISLHAVHRAAIGPDTRVMVLGAGPIGALAIAVLAERGVREIVCVEPSPMRRTLASAVGATELRVPDDLEVPSIAEPQRIVDGACDVVLECSGAVAAMEAGLAQLRPGGTLVLVGSGIQPPRLDPNRILLNELVVTGAFNYDADGFADALDLLSSGRLPVDALLEPGDVPLAGLLDALRGLAAGRIAGKVLVRP